MSALFLHLSQISVHLPNMSSSAVSFPVSSIAAGPSNPHSIVTACEDAELSGTGGTASAEPRFVEVRSHGCFGRPWPPRGNQIVLVILWGAFHWMPAWGVASMYLAF